MIELILQLPDTGNNENYCLLEARITRIEQQYDLLKIDTLNNTKDIGKCIETIDSINIQDIETQLRQVQKSVNNIEQYLRVNNIEIVGLPDPTENQSHEEVILEAINSLENLAYKVTRDDIDISHPIPTRRRDGKKLAVCRFLSRKTKIDVLGAKKKARDFKYNNSIIYINEHLSPENRRLFAEASKKRKDLNFKFIWTNNGITYVRKEEGSPQIIIDSDEAQGKLV